MNLLRILDKLYYLCPQSRFVWRSIRYCIRVLTNIYARFFMSVLQKRTAVGKDTIIVSLTSFPARINSVWMTVASILNQSYENLHIILWLSEKQFNGGDSIPKQLIDLIKNGFEIRFVDDDLRPHKKYFYVMQEFPDNDVITVDDDIIYHPDLIQTLVNAHIKHPNCVICNRGTSIDRGNYSSWKTVKAIDEERVDILPTGIGGVYYPSHTFDNTPIFDKEAIKHTCLNGDDLWLNFMTRLNGHKVVYTGFNTGLVTILSSQSSALCNDNIKENHNDLQIKNITNWAQDNLNCDFYVNIN